MKKLGKFQFAAGFVLGGLIFGGITALAANGVLATLSVNKIYVDGAAVNITAYAIEGHNYVQLRDIAEAVDFGVDYDGATNSVIVDSTASYAKPTAVAPLQSVATPSPTTSGYPDKPQHNKDLVWNVNPWTHYDLSAEAIKVRDTFIASLDGLSDLGKLKKINDFIGEHLTYDLKYKDVNGIDTNFWTTETRGVCRHYSAYTAYLCNLAEIPCVGVDGSVSFSTDTHIWNEVYIDGKWEFFDCTPSTNKVTGEQSSKFEKNFGETNRIREGAVDATPKSTLKSKEKKLPGSTT
jgi:hypothetical protein